MSQDADGKGVQIKLHSSMFSAGIVGHSKHHLCWQPQPCYSLRMANLVSPVALLVSKTIHLPAVQRSIPPPSHQLGLQATLLLQLGTQCPSLVSWLVLRKREPPKLIWGWWKAGSSQGSMMFVTRNPAPSIVVIFRLYFLCLKSKEDKHLNNFDYIHAAGGLTMSLQPWWAIPHSHVKLCKLALVQTTPRGDMSGLCMVILVSKWNGPFLVIPRGCCTADGWALSPRTM